MVVGVGLYVRNSQKAVELYKKAFGLTLGYHVLNEDGSFFHSELYKGEESALSVVESAEIPGNNPVQLGFQFEDKQELIDAFQLLSEGGNVRMDICELPWSPCAAEVQDCFGVRWYLTLQQHRPEE